MTKEYEKNQADEPESKNGPDADRPAVDDPLLELARIVQKNKHLGDNVNRGRVGSTDYFAELNEFSPDSVEPEKPGPKRVESSFAGIPVTEDDNRPFAFETSNAPAPIIGEIRNQFFARGQDESAPDTPNEAETESLPEKPSDTIENVSPLWPRLNNPQLEKTPAPDPAPLEEKPEAQFPPVATHPSLPGNLVPSAGTTESREAAQDRTVLAPTVALDLEQNLTAELEDELVGALRQSVDETVLQAPADEPQPQPGTDPFDEITEVEETAQLPVSQTPDIPAISGDAYPEVLPDKVKPFEERSVRFPYHSDPVQQEPAKPVSQVPVTRVEAEPPSYRDSAAVSETRRPTIDESDLFAALNPGPTETGLPAAVSPTEEKDGPAGIETLFADLDFPERGNRKPLEADPTEQETAPDSTADDIDEMAWPAAASAVPQVEEDETLPPPEGYDLDAVARAMQESDPSLSGAGVLPPHSTAEKDAIPQARERSRRGLYVTLGILGFAVLGGATFFFVDGDSVQVPSGPPPVISGLQEPLKVYPEQTQAQANDQASKLIYDRVGGESEAAPERLQLPETPQPAELPPAPEGTGNGADLAPGTPKQVTTIRVRPDGTFETEGASAPSGSTSAGETVSLEQAEQAPVISTPTIAVEIPRTVETTPVASEPAVSEPVTTAAQPEEAAPVQIEDEAPAPVAVIEPEAPAVPSLVGDDQQSAPAEPDETPVTEAAEPAAPVPTVIPRKKPEPPVQVARAPASQTAPAAPAQQNGPLNLNQAANAPAPAAPANAAAPSGSIPSGTYIVQVTSQRSAAAARDAYSGLQSRFPSILGNRDAVIISADLGDRGVFYRARIPTGSRGEANTLCENLKGAGGDCFVRRQP